MIIDLEDLTPHPAADVFPLMTGPEFDSFVEDIRDHGLRQPILIDAENRIIDGRNRAAALIELGKTSAHVELFDGDEKDVVPFIVSANIHRRHLDASQRGMIAARLANLDDGQRAASIDAPVSQTDAATLLNISRPTVQRAAEVVKKGVAELAQAVVDGTVSLGAASELAHLPVEEQREVVAAGPKAAKKKAAALRKKDDHPSESQSEEDNGGNEESDVISETIVDHAYGSLSMKQLQKIAKRTFEIGRDGFKLVSVTKQQGDRGKIIIIRYKKGAAA